MMSRFRVVSVVAASALVLGLAVSSSGADPAGGADDGRAATCPSAPYPTDGNGFDPADFGPGSATIDHRYFPLEPGTQWVHTGSTLEGNRRIRHRLVFTVTDLTKEIACVRTVVGWDRDFSEGELVEEELIFFAQAKDGTVWHLGQYPEVYDEGQLDGAAPWLVGYLKGAKAGIAMLADPRAGTPAYSEGFAPPPYFWDDFGRVFRTGQETCVPAGCFDDVLVTEEFEPTKPGAFQLKFYAPGVGNVRTGWRGPNEEEREVLRLVELRHLDAEAMAAVRERALAMEARAVVYGLAPPLEPAA